MANMLITSLSKKERHPFLIFMDSRVNNPFMFPVCGTSYIVLLFLQYTINVIKEKDRTTAIAYITTYPAQ